MWLAGLRTLVSKMPFLVTIVTGGLVQVPIFPTRWLIAAMITIVSSRSLGHVDPSGRAEVLRPEAARAAIATIFIAPTFLVIPTRFLGLDGLEAMRKHDLCLVKAEWKGALVPGRIFGRFQGGAVTPRTVNIYLTDPQRKV